MTKLRELESVKGREELFKIDPRALTIEEGWNPRTDWTSEERLKRFHELKNSIKENGVQEPLKIEKDEEDILIVRDGERRLRAVRELIKEGVEIQTVVCRIVKPGTNDAEKIFLALNANTGEKLHPVEEGDAFKRLKNYGFSIEEIAKKVGYSVPTVHNRLKLAEAGPTLKKKVLNGEVKTTEAVEIVKNTHGNLEEENRAAEEVSENREREKTIKENRKSSGQPIRERRTWTEKILGDVNKKLNTGKAKPGDVIALIENLQALVDDYELGS